MLRAHEQTTILYQNQFFFSNKMTTPLRNEYGPISRDSLEDETLNLSGDSAFFSEKQLQSPLDPRSRRKCRLNVLTALNITLLLAQIVVIGWYSSQYLSKSGHIEMEYGRNYDYMSLDHKYDHLWEQDVAANEAGIVVLKDHGGKYRDIEYGAISM